ncbi:MAG: BACON domain-containing carbohydrate-binding protein, partial [Betaproteobacteria bacterium]
LTLTANGTAPTVQAGGDATLSIATMAARGNFAPDPTSVNDAPPRAQTTVRGTATCNYTLNPSNLSFSAFAQTMPVRLIAHNGCSWTAQSDAPWLTLGATSGIGNAPLLVSVQPNPSPQPRTATIGVAGALVSVTQNGTVPPPVGNECTSLQLQRAGDQMNAAGLSGPTSVGVLANQDCGWVAQTKAPWISLTAGASGKGNGTLSYMTQSNDSDARSALITIGDKSFSVNQLGVETIPPQSTSDGGGDSGGGSGGDGGSSGGSAG